MSQGTEGKESFHRFLEGKGVWFAVLTTVAISIGGLVEIVPMFTVKLGPEALPGVTAYTPLEIAGRDIYIREGCYTCHSQMVRPMRAEILRYGEWTRAGEYAYDHPFLLGSRRIGPDLQRVGGKYPDAWHYEHMRDPRSTSPGQPHADLSAGCSTRATTPPTWSPRCGRSGRSACRTPTPTSPARRPPCGRRARRSSAGSRAAASPPRRTRRSLP